MRWGSARLYLTLEAIGLRSERAAAHAGWSEAAVAVLINGSACPSCVIDGGQAVRLAWSDAIEGAPTSVVVRLGGGASAGHTPTDHTPAMAATTTTAAMAASRLLDITDVTAAVAASRLRDGHAAETSWERDEASRRLFTPSALGAGCAPNASIAAWAANASAFSRRMADAGLGRRFEAAQAGALLRALNVTAARCEGRRDGTIAPMPAEPAAWAKYKLLYNQSAVEDYFDDRELQHVPLMTVTSMSVTNAVRGIASHGRDL